MPEMDAASLKAIYGEFIRGMDYRPETPITAENVSYRALQKEFAKYKTAPWFENTCNAAASIAELPYPDHSEEIRYQVAKYTWLILYIDDAGYGTLGLDKLENFQRCLINGIEEPEGQFFQTYRNHLAQFYRLYETIPANGIVLSSIDFINGNLLEQMPNIQGMKINTASASWPYFLRRRSGTSLPFAFMLFPKEVNIDLAVYIQVVEDMTIFTDFTNDILSFYKEYLEGEQHTYVYNRAAVTRRSVEDALKDIVEDTVQAHRRVVEVLEGSGNTTALDIWRKFANGLMGFHFTSKRYRLHELVDVE
ncbi:terpenoid synthase [Agrocybe pediades]|nr:terpenoid synthase [Agrocybe pediades]